MKTPKSARIILMIIFPLLFSPLMLTGQPGGETTLRKSETLFARGLSPSILPGGRIEVNYYNSLFSMWWAIHGSLIESPPIDRLRQTEFNSNLEMYYGTSENNRWDMGARIKYGRTRLDNEARSSPLRVFEKSDDIDSVNPTGNDATYAGIKDFSFRFRLMPFYHAPQLTLNAGISFVLIRKDKEEMEHLNAYRPSVDLNLAYYHVLNKNKSSFYYFILNGTAYLPGFLPDLAENSQWLYGSTFSSFFVQRFGTGRSLLIYPGLSYNIAFKQPGFIDKPLIKTSDQILGILGIQFNTSEYFSFDISSAVPFLYETAHLLQRPVRESYSFLSIGCRALFN